jgi:4-amino-4-deoxy-L-arabinose transferase-like glycosyltransferase
MRPATAPSPLARDGARTPWLRTSHEAVAVVGACALFALLAGLRAARQAYPYFDDVTYLELGSQIRDLGGPLGLLRELFAGRFAEANRHPLYLAVLGIFGRPEEAFFREAQAVNVALGVAAILSCWWTARRHFGRLAGLFTILALAVGRTLLESASRPWCEPLLLAVWARALDAILEGLDPAARRPARAFLRAGVWSGLAFLAKGTGMFLPVSVGLTLLVRERARILRDPRAWSFALAFLVTASPLLVRNQRLFGSPLYNQNSRYLWMDRLPDYAEVFAPGADALLPHGFVDYVRHVTPGALAWRFAAGLGETVVILLDAVAPDAEHVGGPLHVAAILAALLVVAVALRWLWRLPPGAARTFLLVHAGWSFAFLFVFSVNGGNSRYFLPLAGTVLLPAAAARLAEEAAAVGSLRRSRWVLRAGAVLGAAVAGALLVEPDLALYQPGMREVQTWLVAHLAPGDVYAVDARTHLQPSWLAPRAHQIVVSASWAERPVPEATLLDHLRRQRVRFVVLDATSTAHMASPGDPAGRRYLFYDRLPLAPDGSLPAGPFPGGLRAAYRDPATPCRWAVLETPWARAAASEDAAAARERPLETSGLAK